MKLRELFKKSIFLEFIFQMILLVLSRLIGLFNSVNLIKTLGPYNIGYTNIIQTAASQSAVIYDGGMNNIGIRHFSESNSLDIDYLKTIVSFRFFIISIFSFFWIFTILLLNLDNSSIWIISYLIIVNNALDIGFIYRCINRYTIYLLISSINPILIFILCYFFLNQYKVLGIDLKFNIIASSSSLVLSWLYFYNFNGSFPIKKIKLKDFKKLFIESKFMWLNSSIGIFYPALQVYLIAFLLDVEKNGIYKASLLLMAPIELIMTTFNGIMLPHITKWKLKGLAYFKKKVITSSAYLCLIFFPVLVFVLFLKEEYFHLILGEKFIFSLIAFKILFLGKVYLLVFSIFSYSIIANRHDNFFLRSTIFISIANLVLNIFLIPPYQLTGAAISTMLSDVLLPSFLFLKFYRINQINSNNQTA